MRPKTMTSRRIEIDRFNVISQKPFEAVLTAIKTAVGQPYTAEFAKATTRMQTFAEFEDMVRSGLGKTGLMMFMELDHGAILRRESGLDTPKMIRLVIGNPLIMKEMAKRVPDAASYAPVTVLVDERPDGVHLTYDKMASLLAPYRDEDALAVARDLDSKIERLLCEAAE
jgi:uncharacterized protein (DUF302 family)